MNRDRQPEVDLGSILPLIVFDMDGTIYNFDSENGSYEGSSLQKRVFQNAASFIVTLSGKSLDEACDEVETCLRRKQRLSLYVSDTYGVTIREYFEGVWDIDPEGLVQGDPRIPQLINDLNEKGASMVLLTSAPLVWQKRLFQYLGLDEKAFYKILTMDQFDSKKEVMREIKTIFGERPAFAVGDQYETDVRPAEELGYTGHLVKSVDDTVLFIEGLLGREL